jgi:hypothetical protein
MENIMAEHTSPKHHLTRKAFIQLSAAGAAGFLAACQHAEAPTDAPADTPTPPSSTEKPATATPDDVRGQPDITSRVVQTHGAEVWKDDALSPPVLRRMLDASITRLTGADDARDAWASLFSPDDRIAVKVNAFYNSLIWTHVPLVTAVTDCLQDAGVPADRIVVYDQTSDELTTAGFVVNREDAGIRCYGSDTSYTADNAEVDGMPIALSPVLSECTALINMPVLKAHMLSGITFAMKNHFGSTQYPGTLHSGIARKIAALNALPEIRDRTRLILGDVLEANLEYGYSFPYWEADYRGDSILMSYDPVAHDAVGLDILAQLLADTGKPELSLMSIAEDCLTEAAALNLGTYLPESIERVELNV